MAEEEGQQDHVDWTRFGLDPKAERSQTVVHQNSGSGPQINNSTNTNAKYDEANATVKDLFDEEQVYKRKTIRVTRST